MPLLHPDRLFSADPATRSLARALYETVQALPIVSPHGHTEAAWFANDAPFPNPAALFLQPDHYVHRMLYSQGVSLDALGLNPAVPVDPRAVWRLLAEHYYLFQGTPTRLWLDYAFVTVFGLDERLQPSNADAFFDHISAALATPAFHPRALFERFRIELLATTNAATDTLEHHLALRQSGWHGCVVPTFRPDAVIDPETVGFVENLRTLGEQTGADTETWKGYLAALRHARARFKQLGCTATDHGHPTAQTADLSPMACEALFHEVRAGRPGAERTELFRAQMLTEMARMSLDDGLVMQLHPGAFRNHNQDIFARYGRDMGADVPLPTDYVRALQPLLNRFGNDARLRLILFTLDETTYSRELAPLAGHYPCLRLGPAWWFHDSPEGMRRYREQVTETAGFYNTVGFNDDTRAFLSIPARHDVARRVDCGFLARLVTEHRLEETEAYELAQELAVGLARRAYRLTT